MDTVNLEQLPEISRKTISGKVLILIGLPILIASWILFHFSSDDGLLQPVALFLLFPSGGIIAGIGFVRMVLRAKGIEGTGLDTEISKSDVLSSILPLIILVVGSVGLNNFTIRSVPAQFHLPDYSIIFIWALGYYLLRHLVLIIRKYLPAKLSIIILIVLLLVSTAYAGIWWWSNQQEANVVIPIFTPRPSVSATPTKDWKTYTNTEYGFQLTFTDEWMGYKVVKTTPSYLSNPYVNYAIQIPTSDHAYKTGYATPFSVTVYPLSMLKYLSSGDSERAQNSKLGQNNSYLFTNSDGSWQDIPTEYRGKNMQIPQILSTFKFTNSADTSTWKTYIDAGYGFSFQYPADWIIKTGNDYPGSAQGEDYIKLTKGNELIYSGTKTDCLPHSYCKTIGTWPSFSTVSTDPEAKSVIDNIVKTFKNPPFPVES